VEKTAGSPFTARGRSGEGVHSLLAAGLNPNPAGLPGVWREGGRMWQTASDDTDDFEGLQNSGADKPNPPDSILGGLLSGLRQGRPLTYHEGV